MYWKIYVCKRESFLRVLNVFYVRDFKSKLQVEINKLKNSNWNIWRFTRNLQEL